MYRNEKYIYGEENVQVPAHLNFGKFMLDALKRKDDEVAIENVSTGEFLTYKQLTRCAVNLSLELAKKGVKRGDVVALGIEKNIAIVPIALGIIFSGATFTPYSLATGRAELRHKINTSKPKYFICTEQFLESYRDIIEEIKCVEVVLTIGKSNHVAINIESLLENQVDVDKFEPVSVEGQSDIALIFYSSGTTGLPKGVKLSHLNCILNSLSHDYENDDIQTGLIHGTWFHNYDSFITYKFLQAGKKLVYIQEKFTRENMLQCFEKHQVNIAFMIPQNLYDFCQVKEKYDVPSLKILYSRSCCLHIRTIEALRERFPTTRIVQGYGMTEAGEPASENWGHKPGSVGKVWPGATLKIVDISTREPLGPNEHGEVCIKGPNVMQGYIGLDPADYLDEEGFFKTGDMGYYDEDKYIYIIERIKEFIIVSGFKVNPTELETIIMLHPGIREVCVVGKIISSYEQQPTAFVVKEPGSNVTEQQLIDYVAKEVSPQNHLTGGVHFVPELPRSSRGKILRRVLREQLNQ